MIFVLRYFPFHVVYICIYIYIYIYSSMEVPICSLGNESHSFLIISSVVPSPPFICSFSSCCHIFKRFASRYWSIKNYQVSFVIGKYNMEKVIFTLSTYLIKNNNQKNRDTFHHISCYAKFLEFMRFSWMLEQ